MAMKRLGKCVIFFGVALSFGVSFGADRLATMPTIKFQVSEQEIAISRLGDIKAREIVVDGNRALINSRRGLWLLKANSDLLEKTHIKVLANQPVWFGHTCAFGKGFLIGMSIFPEAQRIEERNSSRGEARAGPEPAGFLILDKSGQEKYLPKLRITSRPPVNPDLIFGKPDDWFSGNVQSCARYGDRVVIGSYGALGTADFNKQTIRFLEEDYGMAMSRSPLLVEKSAVWLGIDSGGLEGAALMKKFPNGKTKEFVIRAEGEYDIVSYTALLRHQGKLIVGATHGLFLLDEKSGHFLRLDFGKEFAGQPVTHLASHRGKLWVFIGEKWLQADLNERRAVLYADALKTRFTLGVPFGNTWLLSGPGGLWKSSLRW